MSNLSGRLQMKGYGIYFGMFFLLLSLTCQPGLKAEDGGEIGIAAGKIKPLSSPVRIAAGNNSLLYVSDYIKKRVVIYKVNKFNLRAKKQIDIGGFPLGLAVFNDKFIFVGNSSRNQIQVYRENGKFAYKFLVRAKKPNDIAVSKMKFVYVVASDEDLIKVYGLYGKFKFSFGGTGSANGEFNFPSGIAINDINNEVIISDFMNKRVQVFDLDGNWIRSFGGGMFMSTVDRPQGISIDKNRNYHIVDAQQACIHVFNEQGTRITSYGQYGMDAGQLRTPLDIVIGKDGSAFVTSNLNRRIEIFREIAK